MTKHFFGALAFLTMTSGTAIATPAADSAAAVPVPMFKAGDSWIFDQTIEKGQTGFSNGRLDYAVDRVDGDTIIVGSKRDGAPTGEVSQIMGADWSRREVIDGKETVTYRPFAFPMGVGQTWKSDWVDSTRRGNVLSGHAQRSCTAVAWENVTVAAGTFHALKVVCKGVDELTVEVPARAISGTVAGGAGATGMTHVERGGHGKVTNLTYGETYYAPEVKNYVKAIDEKYNADNVRLSRITGTLVSFKPGS